MLERFLPRKRVDTVYEINLDELRKAGVKGIIADLDNTLVGAKVPLATPELARWLTMVKDAGFQVVIVSNNNEMRVAKFAEPVELSYISRAKKPSRRAFRRALAMMRLQPQEAVVVGDQLLTDVLGANRLGVHAILVTPIAPQDESVFTRFNRRIERMIFAKLKKRGLLVWDN